MERPRLVTVTLGRECPKLPVRVCRSLFGSAGFGFLGVLRG